MEISIFDYTHYRKYLEAALPTEGEKRGARTKLAHALGCQSGFVSLVIGGGSHFSLEHAIKTALFLKLDEEEKDYFLLLIQHERAGIAELKLFFQTKIEDTQKKRREIREHIKTQSEFSEEIQNIYYSAWYYPAVHLCLFNPKTRDKASIAKYLGMTQKRTSHVLKFLITSGLVKQIEGGSYVATEIRAHLPSDSPLLQKHHHNWRIKSLQSLEDFDEKDLHYSAVLSLSPEAAGKIRKILLESIQKSEPILKEAKDDCIYVMGIDWFELGRQKQEG